MGFLKTMHNIKYFAIYGTGLSEIYENNVQDKPCHIV